MTAISDTAIIRFPAGLGGRAVSGKISGENRRAVDYSRLQSDWIGGDRVVELPPENRDNSLEALLAETAQGDRDAFARLYQLTSPKLFAIALKMLRRRDAAEEVLQEVYLSIWRKASQYRPERGQPLAWMSMIVRYRVIDRIRAQDREASEVRDSGGDVQAVIDAHAVELHPAQRQDPALRGCIEQLHDNQQRVILLAFYYGFTHEELSARMDAPLGTVKSWVRRGLLQLKDCLEE